jgi:hypothetical protein
LNTCGSAQVVRKNVEVRDSDICYNDLSTHDMIPGSLRDLPTFRGDERERKRRRVRG